MQNDSGISGIFSHPAIYTSFQYLMGARQGWIKIVRDYVRAKPGDVILDLGCGPADILNYLPVVKYWGFDVNPRYISKAREIFGARGNFICKTLDEADLFYLPVFDVVLLSGVLHHLDDSEAKQIVWLAWRSLKIGGRLVTVDPCLVAHENPIARYLIAHDRGQNVRDESGYRAVAQNAFHNVSANVISKAWIPYTRCYMVCTR